jgi:GLPGLI family protein
MNEIWCFEDIYKNYNQDSWIKHSGRYKDGCGIEKKMSQIAESNNFQWQINQQEKRIIAGVECIKATSPKGYTAWFAPKLPYPDGPRYGVYNLPGLVLELETAQGRWAAKSIMLNNDKVVIPDLKLAQNDQEINLSYTELNKLEHEKVIILNKNTSRGQWLKFKSLQKK